MNCQFLLDYLDYLENIEGKSPATTKEYFYDIRQLLTFYYGEEHVITQNDLENLTVLKILTFLNDISFRKSVQAAARSRKIASIRSFYQYLYRIRKLSIDIDILEIKTPKLSRREPVHLTLEQCQSLFKAVQEADTEDWIKKRDLCIITFFLHMGLRLSELSNISMTQIMEDEIVVRGKGSKDRRLYLNEACQEAMAQYLKVRMKNSHFLFISKKNDQLTPRGIQFRIEKYIKLAGLDPRVYTTHKLRHTFATLLYKSGVDILSLKEMLGHESIATTQIYTHIYSEKMKKDISKNPLLNIKSKSKKNKDDKK